MKGRASQRDRARETERETERGRNGGEREEAQGARVGTRSANICDASGTAGGVQAALPHPHLRHALRGVRGQPSALLAPP